MLRRIEQKSKHIKFKVIFFIIPMETLNFADNKGWNLAHIGGLKFAEVCFFGAGSLPILFS